MRRGAPRTDGEVLKGHVCVFPILSNGGKRDVALPQAVVHDVDWRLAVAPTKWYGFQLG